MSLKSLTSVLKTSQNLGHFLLSPLKIGNVILGNLRAECLSCLETQESVLAGDLVSWFWRSDFSICLNKAEWESDNVSATSKSLSTAPSSPSSTMVFWISLSNSRSSGRASSSFCWLTFSNSKPSFLYGWLRENCLDRFPLIRKHSPQVGSSFHGNLQRIF